MVRKVIVEEPKQPTQEEIVSLPEKEQSSEFQVEFNQEEGIVNFKLTDGTPVQMNSPKTRQFLLLESFVKSAESEYKTDSFIVLKLASLCITKFGAKDKISFEELIDTLEIEDVERVAAAIGCFQDKFKYLAGKSATI